ncbi:ABC1 family protein [Tribonema minus]|uniref:ABC1 family protein n=1 Tax=Tribonema minus TaxID=303371 RepID=A0A835Z895_9STRA|nr:ABC1 family protein [Tribonema minus]
MATWEQGSGGGRAHAAGVAPAAKAYMEAKQTWPLRRYNGTAVEEHYAKRPWEVAERVGRIGPPLLGWYLQTQVDNRTRNLVPEDVARTLNLQRADQLRELLANSGSVTFIKSGQALSLRQDLIKNAEYVRELTKLQDAVGTFPNPIAFKIIEEDLGRPAHEIFDFIYEDPVASASIGQVYKAIVRETGKVVALKVQRPEAFSSAAVDMFILRRFAAWFKEWKKLRSNLVGIADEFGAQLFGELDYVQEGRNAVRFKELYGNIPGIYVPDIYFDLTSRRVLTMEWVDGEKGPWLQDGRRLLTVGLQCSVMQVLDTGFLHADPHRGNLLRMPDGRLAYLDFGMMCSVPADQRYALVGATLGLQNKDIGMVANNLVKLGFLPDETRLDIVVPALEQAVFEASDGQGASRLNFTRLSASISELSDELQFRVPPFYSLIVRTLTILEGLALAVDPDFRLIKGAYPFIAKQVLNSDSGEMRSLMKATLLDRQGKIKWRRLEELVSIAGAAKVADTDTQFDDLRRAQKRSDLRVKVGLTGAQVEEIPSEVTLDLTLAILDFILSENGRFLREPLIDELLDTVDSIGGLAVEYASANSRGLISAPQSAPDRERLATLWNIVVQVAQSQRRKLAVEERANGLAIADEGLDFPTLRAMALRVCDALTDPERTALYLPVAQRLAGLAREIAAQVVERQAVRVVNAAISRTAGVFPVLINAVDAVNRFNLGRPSDNSAETRRRQQQQQPGRRRGGPGDPPPPPPPPRGRGRSSQ